MPPRKSQKPPPREWTPWELRPERQFLRTLTSAYYDWQEWELGAKLRGIKRLDRATRHEVLEAAERGDDVTLEPRERGPKPGHLPPVELTATQLAMIDELASSAENITHRYSTAIAKALPAFGEAWDWLNRIHGIGPIMAGYLLSQADPYRSHTPSALWKFAALHVVPTADGRGRAWHPEPGKRNESNAMARAKMIGVLGPGLIKAGIRHPQKIRNEEGGGGEAKIKKLLEEGWEEVQTLIGPRLVRGAYTRRYFEYRYRLHTRPDRDTNWGYLACSACTREYTKAGVPVVIPLAMRRSDEGVWSCPGCGAGEDKGKRTGQEKHMTDAAVRYMVKMFLLDFWKVLRAMEGLPVLESYHERQRGYAHHERQAQA